LSLRDLRRDFLDYDRFLLTIETHGLNTPSKDAQGEFPLHQPNAANLVEFLKKRNLPWTPSALDPETT
jgi:hypothetical protein